MTSTYLTATEATRLFANGKLSPVELLTHMVVRVKQVETVVNSVTEEMIGAALEAEMALWMSADR